MKRSLQKSFCRMATFPLIVPDNYQHGIQLTLFKKRFHRRFADIADFVTDERLAAKADPLVAGREYLIELWRIDQDQSFLQCVHFQRSQQALFTGAQGLSLVWQLHEELLPPDKDIISLRRQGRIGNLLGMLDRFYDYGLVPRLVHPGGFDWFADALDGIDKKSGGAERRQEFLKTSGRHLFGGVIAGAIQQADTARAKLRGRGWHFCCASSGCTSFGPAYDLLEKLGDVDEYLLFFKEK